MNLVTACAEVVLLVVRPCVCCSDRPRLRPAKKLRALKSSPSTSVYAQSPIRRARRSLQNVENARQSLSIDVRIPHGERRQDRTALLHRVTRAARFPCDVPSSDAWISHHPGVAKAETRTCRRRENQHAMRDVLARRDLRHRSPGSRLSAIIGFALHATIAAVARHAQNFDPRPHPVPT